MSKFLVLLLLLIGTPATAATLTIGSTSFPLGEVAFPTGSTCIDPGGCPGDVRLLDSALSPVSRERALLGHDLSLVVINMDETNEFRVVFPEPIVNLPGDDLYLAQAEFTGYLDLEDGIHSMQIRFDGSTTWHTIQSDQFARDDLAATPIVNFGDPETKQVGYFLWFATGDLADFGYAPGESIAGFDLRGLAGDGGGLDTVAVGNLNAPAPEPGTGALLGAGILGLTLGGGRRGRRNPDGRRRPGARAG